ncbi:hypothetical protein AJ85_09440 [Alkalihalobacillus alcalophilus ATCC 27647 = CGMCC 1.3604]|uniref:YqhG n=1 Tax=Alkalihalobacillus alcalophilus ATCC 27647 = CGMCC 1.3604 TaxID=1218173 RepID=A0A094YR09_ALKAL|nr:YqhG family protein [Alkalihalobacillus alcalophilus]KGA95902.1 hypothetical protein BALCAV_0219520 [Alkalihalobacillus alcalophilus ATCC 27647 = CGMCC 1.3604]MED1562885.1 YqhG family protein [Alkalihalobacillus alcalophilus]THG90660.1 hypothetical protein AJ85_09440 [Alkalihalobacillus alcalophilus ATCC 27647 = CGMCC 1.3604]
MQQPHLHKFIEDYFVANECDITEKSPYHLTVQLTPELDKLIMNRPFYWHYLEKTGGIPNPMQVTFITNANQCPEDLQGEKIHFGSPRLHQLFNTTKTLGGYVRMYENLNVQGQQSVPLHPWLCLNIKISFCSDRKKEILLSLGINLIHGQIVPQFFDKVKATMLTPKMPDLCFTLSPFIQIKSGINRLKKVVQTFAENEDDTWAQEAHHRWQEETNLLESFYEDLEEKPESYHVEKQALEELYSPYIDVSIINGGMFYLEKQVFQ